MNAAAVVMGIACLAVGAGTGGLMLAYPAGLSPNWPIAVALLAPGVFALAGLHLLGTGLGYPRFAIAVLQILVVCMWGMLHWYAFFTANMQCTAGVSFLGLPLFRWRPGEVECQAVLQTIVIALDAIILVPVVLLGWRRLRKPPGEAAGGQGR
jgi:hypothetical protein